MVEQSEWQLLSQLGTWGCMLHVALIRAIYRFFFVLFCFFGRTSTWMVCEIYQLHMRS